VEVRDAGSWIFDSSGGARLRGVRRRTWRRGGHECGARFRGGSEEEDWTGLVVDKVGRESC
jgi:hypothetical protein